MTKISTSAPISTEERLEAALTYEYCERCAGTIDYSQCIMPLESSTRHETAFDDQSCGCKCECALELMTECGCTIRIERKNK